ncbi:PAS-domain containing protein [Thalassorhabdomicrobium marinisediminis]|uniref:PAS domain-containing protein n=1 Tax=Thalassorhabdomicrobium marinisediminis TaxID=2170577 RepID=A0A2T7FZP5_9RHOB|nr:PAS-domain containing protein [Thalassorhabdomicrobium marinisediminis]PVA07640.1 hypothetical protein DC363_03135 [Thalassorhabdomicrobium marinisediminis]
MQQYGVIGTVAALFLGIAVAVVLLIYWIRANSSSAIISRTLMHEAEESIAFLFDDQELVDLTPRAKGLMTQADKQRTDWENLVTLLSARFPHLRSQCADLASVGKKTILPEDGGTGWIEAEFWNGLARITLVQDDDPPDKTLDALTASAMEHELNTLRCIGEDSPQLIWKRDAEGVLIWANRAYIEMSETLNPVGADEIRPWPPHDVFQEAPPPQGTAPLIDMHRVDLPGAEAPIWYEVTSLRRGTDTIYFAIDATPVVAARDAQRTFVQTLTKTFAHLSVGLAIFDEDRRLVLFNPALVDLTTLPADFLIGRPTLFAVLDRLRNLQMIPEPKNYNTWRDEVVALETAAAAGSYHETWTLPNGQTFRVTGKPHPNGAIAMLIEDISDDVSLTRKFRSQIDTTRAVIDNVPGSIAVFSASGALILANEAYRQLWGAQHDGSFADQDFLDELATWQALSAPSPVWMKLKKTLTQGGSNGRWSGQIWLDNQVEVTCHYAPLPEGNHQITFLPVAGESRTGGRVEPLAPDMREMAQG